MKFLALAALASILAVGNSRFAHPEPKEYYDPINNNYSNGRNNLLLGKRLYTYGNRNTNIGYSNRI